ncbi:MAG: DNA recombination protein RmuC [Planctomycetota bacterium]
MSDMAWLIGGAALGAAGAGVAVALLRRKSAGGAEEAALLRRDVEALRAQMQEGISSQTSLVNQQLALSEQKLAEAMRGVSSGVNDQLGRMIGEVAKRLQENFAAIQKSGDSVGSRLDNAAKVVGEVQSRLGKMEEANQRIFEVGKDIAGLQEILRAPKARGGLGELMLGDLLAQTIPAEHYTLQHTFKNRQKVDAAIRLGDRLVPVDAKFPLENFERFLKASNDEERGRFRKDFARDVKKHIQDISEKYILPDEGTFDFALMYIPAENVYYEIIVKDEMAEGDRSLGQFALDKRVIPVSPNNFYAYLRTILLGLKGMHVEKEAQAIQDGLRRLQGEFGKFGEDFRKIGVHLENARKCFEEGEKRLVRLGDRLDALEGADTGKVLPVAEEPKRLEEG